MQRVKRAAAVFGISVPSLSRPVRLVLVWLLAATTIALPVASAGAVGSFSNVSVALSDPQPSDTASYTVTASSVDGASTVKCVQLIWSTAAGATTAPTGFSGASGSIAATSSTLINSSASGWSLAKSDGTSSTGQNNIYQYTNSTGVVPGTTTGATFVASGIVNSSAANTAYYLSINTYSDTGCSATINSAIVDYINTTGSTMSMTINPVLTFAIASIGASTSCDGTTTTQASTATTIPFGTITPATNGVVCQNLQISTNATNGYTVYARYSGPLNNGSHNLADLTGAPNSAPIAFTAAGTEAYGYSTSDSALGTGTANRFTSGSQKWAAMTTSNAEVAYEASGVTSDSFNIGHQVGISTTTYAGVYSTTVIYTCTPIY